MPAATLPRSADSPCVCGRLRRAARALTQLYDDVLAPSGLRVTQYSLLSTLARRGTLRITELATVAMLDRTALSRNLAPLAAQGLVRIAAGTDARTREVSLTRAGESALARALPHWRRAQAQVARQLGEQKNAALIGLLADVEELHPAPQQHPD
jgi:DNA-binding MarR family transcriptional regulator